VGDWVSDEPNPNLHWRRGVYYKPTSSHHHVVAIRLASIYLQEITTIVLALVLMLLLPIAVGSMLLVAICHNQSIK
jgi:hypothetical protein